MLTKTRQDFKLCKTQLLLFLLFLLLLLLVLQCLKDLVVGDGGGGKGVLDELKKKMLRETPY